MGPITLWDIKICCNGTHNTGILKYAAMGPITLWDIENAGQWGPSYNEMTLQQI